MYLPTLVFIIIRPLPFLLPFLSCYPNLLPSPIIYYCYSQISYEGRINRSAKTLSSVRLFILVFSLIFLSSSSPILLFFSALLLSFSSAPFSIARFQRKLVLKFSFSLVLLLTFSFLFYLYLQV